VNLSNIVLTSIKRQLKSSILIIITFFLTVGFAFAEGLPDPGVKLVKEHVGIVITEPQVDFLSPDDVA
jgi:hypothetical protein